MATDIIEIEGIGQKYADQLKALNIHSVQEFLAQGIARKDRALLEKKSGIPGKKLLLWLGMADLFRIEGVGKQFAELLKAAAVDTVKELSQRKALNLYRKLVEMNQEKKLSKTVPCLAQVELWIKQAQNTSASLTY